MLVVGHLEDVVRPAGKGHRAELFHRPGETGAVWASLRICTHRMVGSFRDSTVKVQPHDADNRKRSWSHRLYPLA
jgi:hypothetical protein